MLGVPIVDNLGEAFNLKCSGTSKTVVSVLRQSTMLIVLGLNGQHPIFSFAVEEEECERKILFLKNKDIH